MIPYLKTQAAAQQPFFLVVSLINPHECSLYPRNYLNGDYDDSWLSGDIQLPETVGEDLRQSQRRKPCPPPACTGFRDTADAGDEANYLNFYGNLIKSSDQYLVEILDTLENLSLLDDNFDHLHG